MRDWLEAAICQSELQKQAAARDCMHSSVFTKTDQVSYFGISCSANVRHHKPFVPWHKFQLFRLARSVTIDFSLFAFNAALVRRYHLPIGAAKAGCGKGMYAIIYAFKNSPSFSSEISRSGTCAVGSYSSLATKFRCFDWPAQTVI